MRSTKMTVMGTTAVKTILGMVGTPYIWGGDDPIRGLDCSGTAILYLKMIGHLSESEDYTAQGLFDMYKGFETGTPIWGCFAFFGKTRTKISHVGICLNEFQMIEAGGGGSRTLTVDDAIEQNAYIRIRPIRRRNDLRAFCDPLLSEGR